jgi:short subunit dehydrogenase-like uncharacterized protein
MSWALYGAYGYTGELIAEEALRRGHRPLLLGRDEAKLSALGRRLGLEWKAVALTDPAALRAALSGQRAVVHAAGPFLVTSRPMVDACLAVGAHYLDITGELDVFTAVFARDQEARRAEVALVPGVGLDVVPTDCLAAWVAKQVERPQELFIALKVVGRASGGTLKSALGFSGGRVRRAGVLEPWALGRGATRVRFSSHEAWVLPAPLADLESAFHSTGIPHITTAFAVPARLARLAQVAWPASPLLIELGRRLVQTPPVRARLDAKLSARGGPGVEQRAQGRISVWAQVKGDGATAQGWLEGPDGYAFTAPATVLSVQRLLEGKVSGALSPAMAFGPDFVLEVPGVQRFAHLP